VWRFRHRLQTTERAVNVAGAIKEGVAVLPQVTDKGKKIAEVAELPQQGSTGNRHRFIEPKLTTFSRGGETATTGFKGKIS
jgi:hypothetical protein